MPETKAYDHAQHGGTHIKADHKPPKKRKSTPAPGDQPERVRCGDLSAFVGQDVRITACFAGARMQYDARLLAIRPPLPEGKGGGPQLIDLKESVKIIQVGSGRFEMSEWKRVGYREVETLRPATDEEVCSRAYGLREIMEPRDVPYHRAIFLPLASVINCSPLFTDEQETPAPPAPKLEPFEPNPIPGAPNLREEARLDTLITQFAREVRKMGADAPEWLCCVGEDGRFNRAETIRAKNALMGRPRSDKPIGDAQEWADAIACLDERVNNAAAAVAVGGAS